VRGRRAAGGRWWRSALFLAGQVATVIPFGVLVLPAALLPPLARYRLIRLWALFILRWLKWTCRIDYRVEGRERLPPAPYIILAKHQSAWETFAFQEIFPPQVWVLKRELLWIPFFGWGLKLTDPIAIDRRAGRRALEQVVDQGLARLRSGRCVVIFPEGTRMAFGERGRYNPGGALLAVKSGHPVVPVAHDAGRYWPRRGFLKHPGTVQVRIGPAIDPRGRSAKEVNRLAEAWIEAQVAAFVHPDNDNNGD